MKYIPAVFLFFVLLFAYTKLVGPIPFAVNSTTTTKSDSFQVTGEGTYSVAPDIAYISVGVTASGATVKQVQNDLNAKINAVSAAIKQMGVDAKDIKTTNYSINPSYDYRSGTQKISGYSANTNLSIKIKDIDKTNDVIDAATTAGANEVGGITFDVDDKTKAEDEARKIAVLDAKTKAEHAARIAGFKLGNIINYSESFGNSPRPVMYAKAELMTADSGAPTQIESGSSEIVVTVALTFQLD